MLFDNFKISNYEICRCISDIPGTTIDSMKCMIPKYMGHMITGDYQSRTGLNKNMFANAVDCKLSLPSTITQQGYLTISKYPNEVLDFTNKCNYDSNGDPYIPNDTAFMVEILYEDLMSINLTGKV